MLYSRPGTFELSRQKAAGLLQTAANQMSPKHNSIMKKLWEKVTLKEMCVVLHY